MFPVRVHATGLVGDGDVLAGGRILDNEVDHPVVLRQPTGAHRGPDQRREHGLVRDHLRPGPCPLHARKRRAAPLLDEAVEQDPVEGVEAQHPHLCAGRSRGRSQALEHQPPVLARGLDHRQGQALEQLRQLGVDATTDGDLGKAAVELAEHRPDALGDGDRVDRVAGQALEVPSVADGELELDHAAVAGRHRVLQAERPRPARVMVDGGQGDPQVETGAEKPAPVPGTAVGRHANDRRRNQQRNDHQGYNHTEPASHGTSAPAPTISNTAHPPRSGFRVPRSGFRGGRLCVSAFVRSAHPPRSGFRVPGFGQAVCALVRLCVPPTHPVPGSAFRVPGFEEAVCALVRLCVPPTHPVPGSGFRVPGSGFRAGRLCVSAFVRLCVCAFPPPTQSPGPRSRQARSAGSGKAGRCTLSRGRRASRRDPGAGVAGEDSAARGAGSPRPKPYQQAVSSTPWTATAVAAHAHRASAARSGRRAEGGPVSAMSDRSEEE